jgi:hypothetical protein
MKIANAFLPRTLDYQPGLSFSTGDAASATASMAAVRKLLATTLPPYHVLYYYVPKLSLSICPDKIRRHPSAPPSTKVTKILTIRHVHQLTSPRCHVLRRSNFSRTYRTAHFERIINKISLKKGFVSL